MPVVYDGVTYNAPTVGDAVRHKTLGLTGVVTNHGFDGMYGHFTVTLDALRPARPGGNIWRGRAYHWELVTPVTP